MVQQLAGEDILASDVVLPTVVVKAVTESVTSNAVLQNDDELFCTLAVGIYEITAIISYSGATGADLQTNWTFSGTTTTNTKNLMGPELAVTSGAATLMVMQPKALTTLQQYGSTAGATWLQERLYLVVSVGGTLQFQWAQVLSTASATSVLSASRLIIQQLSL